MSAGMHGADPRDRALVVRALSSVVSTNSGSARQPGRLREKVESALPEQERTRLAPVLHQLVAAAEEQVPAILTSLAPTTEESRARVAADLASARGWRPDIAERAVGLWSDALGLSEGGSTSQPSSGPRPLDDHERSSGHVPADDPEVSP